MIELLTPTQLDEMRPAGRARFGVGSGRFPGVQPMLGVARDLSPKDLGFHGGPRTSDTARRPLRQRRP